MLSSVDRFRRNLAGTSLMAGGGAAFVSMVTKTIDTNDEKSVLDSVAANPGLNSISAVAQLVMVVAMLPAIFGLLRLLRLRGAWLGHVGAALLLLNLVGNAVDVGQSTMLIGLTERQVGPAEIEALSAAEATPAYLVASVFTLVGLLGFPLLAGALWRNGTISRAVPVLMIVAVVSFFFPVPEAIGGALFAVAFGWAGVRVVRSVDREWAEGWQAQPERAGVPVG